MGTEKTFLDSEAASRVRCLGAGSRGAIFPVAPTTNHLASRCNNVPCSQREGRQEEGFSSPHYCYCTNEHPHYEPALPIGTS